MNYFSKENIKQQFKKIYRYPHIIFWTFAILTILVIFAGFAAIPYFNFSKSVNKHSIDYWAMFWAFISALTVPGAIIGYFFNKIWEIRTTNNIKINNKVRYEAPEFLLATQNYEVLLASNKDSILAQESQNKMISKGISLLNLYSQIQNSSPRIKEELFPYAYLIYQKLQPFVDSIPEEFGLPQIFEDIVSESRPYSDLERVGLSTSNILIVRTTREPVSDADILGNWLISSKKATEVKYIIGVSGYVNSAKTYIKTLRVENFAIIDDRRIKFKKSFKANNEEALLRLLKSVTGKTEATLTIKTIIEDLIFQTDWKGINPIVYLSHLENLYKERKQTKYEK